jgi:hypothetical protein
MKPISHEDVHQRPEVLRAKRHLGMAYGITVGLSFAFFTWGIDGLALSRAQALYPWLKFILGAVLCMLAGGAAGWLVAHLEKGILALLIYLVLALGFAWLLVALPFQIFPAVITWLDPEVGNLLNYGIYEDFGSRFGLAMAWISLFMAIAGILQLPLTEPAAFSVSSFGKIVPLIVCSVIMAINGVIVDSLNNEPMRAALIYMNNTIQFSVDHAGEEVDRAMARSMHVGALRGVQEVVSQPRKLIVGSYDQYLDQIHVLVRFGDTWTDCIVVYNQPSLCKYIDPTSP